MNYTEKIQPAAVPSSAAALTVAEIAAKDSRNVEVFRKFGIDFCCGGGLTLQEASLKAGITEGELRSALQLAVYEASTPRNDFAHWDLARLADHIEQVHHGFVRENAPVLLEFAKKVASHHGQNHPELVNLEEGLRLSLADLLAHMEKEEKILFPAIRQLAMSSPSEPALKAPLAFIRQAINRMQSEHAGAGEDLRQARMLTNDYTLPTGACNSYKYLFDKLKEFDNDLRQHIHLENNILFPRALALLENPPQPDNQ
jgi:regulator of cell morphogenesis and NO signaling